MTTISTQALCNPYFNLQTTSQFPQHFHSLGYTSGSKYFTLVGALFREIYATSFFHSSKLEDINMQKPKKLLVQTLPFSCLKFVFRRCKGNSRKLQMKPEQSKNFICLGIYNSRLKLQI